MGPSVVDTVEDLRNIQRSLWEVSPAGFDCSITHGRLQSKCGQRVSGGGFAFVVFCHQQLRCFYRIRFFYVLFLSLLLINWTKRMSSVFYPDRAGF